MTKLKQFFGVFEDNGELVVGCSTNGITEEIQRGFSSIPEAFESLKWFIGNKEGIPVIENEMFTFTR